MATNIHTEIDDQHDIFLSYEKQVENVVIKFYDVLTRNFELDVYMNRNEAEKNEKKLENHMLKSKVFICCITKDYVNLRRCQNEMYYAYMKDKPMLFLMFEKLELQELAKMSISNITTFNIYDEAKIMNEWEGELFNQIIESIENLLERKLERVVNNRGILDFLESLYGTKQKTRPVVALERDIKKPLKSSSSIIISTTTISNDPKTHVPIVTIFSMEAVEFGAKVQEVLQFDFCIKADAINLIHSKTNSFIDSTFGFNRMIYLPSRQRFVITSSYTKSVISLDRGAGWIEKRNPGGLLRAPWAICRNDNDEIFIGDNSLKRILMFDSHWKHLKTFGENTLNGFYDMVVDCVENELYAINLYDSLVIVIDLKTYKLKKKISITTPVYIYVNEDRLFVITSSDLIYFINKTTNEVLNTVRINNAGFMGGIYVDKDSNLYTTLHEVDNEDEKSKDTYFCCISVSENVYIKRVNLSIPNVNDFAFIDEKNMVFISDTHVNIFEWNGNFDTNENKA